jgi:hypothetical protein
MLTPATRSNLLAGTPDYLRASQALPIDIPGKYRIAVWSTNGQMLASAEGEGSRSYSLAPLKNAGTYIVTVDSKTAKLSHRIQIY